MMPPVTEQQIQELTPYYVSGWSYSTNIGYYIHRGSVYVQGSVAAIVPSALGSSMLFNGLPTDIRPAVNTAVRVLIDPSNSSAEYAPDSALGIGPFIPATVSTGGSISLDGGNPFNNDPDGFLSLTFNFSWPLAGAIADTYTPSSAAAYTDGAYWADIDSVISNHDARLHLGGHVKVGTSQTPTANINGNRMLHGLPVADTPLMMSSTVLNGNNWTEMPSKNGYRLFVQGGASLDVQCGGSLAPPSGNHGCGLLADLFYQHYNSGYVARGTKGTRTVESLSCTNFSGTPVSPLPPSCSQRGTNLFVQISGLTTALGVAVTGPTQYAYFFGFGSTAYYKVVVTYSTVTGHYGALCYRCSSGTQTQIGGVDLGVGTSKNVAIIVSPHRLDTGIVGTDVSGTLYFQLNNAHFSDSLGGGSAVGDCAAYYPSGVHSTDMITLNAVGEFPWLVPGDIIDLTDCGWGLPFVPPPSGLLLDVV